MLENINTNQKYDINTQRKGYIVYILYNKYMSDKVSVIIPMYNSEKYIDECVKSVINQTYTNLEIIIIDDCSTDSSLSVVEKIADDRIKLIKLEKNVGVSAARNTGIDAATGDYLCFIDSDDLWVKEKIEKEVEFIKKNNYDFIYSDYAFFNENAEELKKYRRVVVPRKIQYEQAIRNTTIFISTVMLNLHSLKKEDIYMPNLTIGQDTATWWNLLKGGCTAYGINEVLAYYRVHGKSLSSNKIRAIKGAWKIYTREELKYFKRLYCFLCYIKNAVKRRI